MFVVVVANMAGRGRGQTLSLPSTSAATLLLFIQKTSGAGFIAFLLVNRNVDIFRVIHRNHFQ